MKSVSVAEAKNKLPELVHQVEAGHFLRITRRGQAVAVLLSETEYERLKSVAAGSADFAGWAQAWRSSLPAGFEGIAPDELARWRGP